MSTHACMHTYIHPYISTVLHTYTHSGHSSGGSRPGRSLQCSWLRWTLHLFSYRSCLYPRAPQAEGIHQIGDRFEVVVDSTVGKITQIFDTRKKAESWYAAALDLKAKNSLGPLLKGFQAAVESNSKHLEACESVKGNHVMEVGGSYFFHN